ncbi:hypothetical protein JOQ06_020567, partial [Pogonophryne albipinna]
TEAPGLHVGVVVVPPFPGTFSKSACSLQAVISGGKGRFHNEVFIRAEPKGRTMQRALPTRIHWRLLEVTICVPLRGEARLVLEAASGHTLSFPQVDVKSSDGQRRWEVGGGGQEMRELPDAGHVRISLPGPPCSSLSNACKA